ncbi:MAG: GlsB/YeaQ/YmgE family stress response membrane protein [Algiphilus sp.]
MGIISWIVLGLIAGALANWIMPGKDPGGFIVTILIGVAGAFVGGFVGSLVGLGTVGGLSLGSIVTAIVGALILLFAYRLIANRAG